MTMILLALLNGVLIAVTRAINGRLAADSNAFYTSWVNHLVGFVVMCFVVAMVVGIPEGLGSVPTLLYAGGIIGALYVSLNSYIVPKLGVTLATLIVIAGQLIMSVLLDLWLGKITLRLEWPAFMLGFGIVLLAIGFYISIKSQRRP